MTYNFDEVIDRKGTNCLKYDFAVERGYPEGVLPFWVADMDFKTSSYVQDATRNSSAACSMAFSAIPTPARTTVRLSGTG